MVATDYKTITYRHGDFMIDITTTPYTYESWIYVEDVCDKHYMFGMPKEQQSYFEFMKIVEANIKDYAHLCDDAFLPFS